MTLCIPQDDPDPDQMYIPNLKKGQHGLLNAFFPPFFAVSQSGLAGDVCPDPGVPENGKRMGSVFQ